MKYTVASLLVFFCAVCLHAAGPYPGNDADHGVSRSAGTLDAYTGNLSFQTHDLDIAGAVGLHGLSWGRIANSRSTRLEAHFGLGHNWSHNWQWELVDAGRNSEGHRVLSLRRPEGLVQRFTEVGPEDWWPEAAARERMEWSSDRVTVNFPKGGSVSFRRLSGGQGYQLESLNDDFGLSWSFEWSDGRLHRIHEPAGRWLEIGYQSIEGTDGLVHTVIAGVLGSNGDEVVYHYDSVDNSNYPILVGASYPGGYEASYRYAAPADGRRLLLTEIDDPRADAEVRGRQFAYQEGEGAALGQVARVYDAEDGQLIDALFQGSDPRGFVRRDNEGAATYESFLPGGNLEEKVDPLGHAHQYGYDADGRGHRTSETDPLGQVFVYERDVHGNVVREIYLDGTSRSWTHDSQGRILSETDELGHTTVFERDSDGRRTATVHPDGARDWTRYNDFGQPVEQERQGVRQTNTYNAAGQLEQRIDALGNVSSFAYDERGNLVEVTDPLGNSTHFAYNDAGQRTVVKHPDGAEERFIYNEWGQVVESLDALGHSTTYEYDRFGRRTAIVNAAGARTEIAYGEIGTATGYQPVWQQQPDGEETVWIYDERGQLIEQTVAPGTEYAATIRHAYDPVGRRIATTDARESVTLRAYNERGRLLKSVSALGHETHYRYDEAGRRTETIDANGHKSLYSYDTRGRLIAETNAMGYVTRYLYDSHGRRTAIIDDRGNHYRFKYDELGRQIAKQYPNGSTESWTYDANGNEITYVNRAGNVRTRSYDVRNRLIASAWDDGSPAESRSYDAMGRLLEVEQEGESLHRYAYDAAGLLISETQKIFAAGEARKVAYSHTPGGKRDTLRYPDGTEIAYAYNARGEVEAIGAPNADPFVRYERDASGRVIRKPYANQVFSASEYDAVGQLIYRERSRAEQAISSEEYQFDPAGNRTATIFAEDRAEAYGYDAVNQLVEVHQFGLGDSPERSTWFDYDAVGNRERIEDSSSGVTTYEANELNQYTRVQSIFSDGSASTEEPEWDENGNLSRYNGLGLRYDAMNRLISVSGPAIEARFTYDYRNRVTSRTFNGEITFLVYDDWNLIAEYDAAGQLKARYVHGPRIDEVILTVNDHGTFFHHHDALGSVTQLTDVNGVVVESYQYDVYGNVTIFDGSDDFLETSAINNRFLFTGREYLSELDLYDYRNRIYSADLGRFIQADPIRFDAGDVNIYRYVFNNPLRWVDPMGLEVRIPYNVTSTGWVDLNLQGDIVVAPTADGSYSVTIDGDTHDQWGVGGTSGGFGYGVGGSLSVSVQDVSSGSNGNYSFVLIISSSNWGTPFGSTATTPYHYYGNYFDQDE
ncbi:MAG: RHS repeat protein [Opitutales bacterium]|nr:RHS repeat protein [Opitutales bacterium]